jgi:hypothetical protein
VRDSCAAHAIQNVIKDALKNDACSAAAAAVKRCMDLNSALRGDRLVMQAITVRQEKRGERHPKGPQAPPSTRWFGHDDMMLRLITTNEDVRAVIEERRLTLSECGAHTPLTVARL